MKNMRFFLAAFLVVFILSAMQTSTRAENVEVSTYEELILAMRSVKGEIHIVLNESFIFTGKNEEPQITVPSGSQVVIETSGDGAVLSHGNGGPMFYVEEGATLTLNGHRDAVLTLRETIPGEEWSSSCVIAAGSFEANYVSFEGFFAEDGAAVCLSDLEMAAPKKDCILKNCQFSGNHALRGGSVYVGSGRMAEIYASTFTSNTAAEKGNDAYVSGTLVFGDNNILSAYGPLNYETEADGSFLYAGQIYGSGAFELAERTTVSGVISWSMDSAVPESVEVVLLANGFEASRKTVTEDEDGYWAFTFEDLPVKKDGNIVQYDIGEYVIPGFRFSKRGEADVGFEVLYVANPQGTQEGTEGQSTFGIQNEPLVTVSEDDPNAVSVKKSPTNEKAEIGGQAIFIAKAENSSGIIWHLISPDEKEDYRDEEMSSAFSSLELEGLGTERLKIKVIPLSLNGWKVRAEFSGIGGPVFSEDAVITIEGADVQTAEEQPESIESPDRTEAEQIVNEEPEDTVTPEATEIEPVEETVPVAGSEAKMVELKKSPTNEHADLGGNAIFIARADHAVQIIWHVISPDDTVDYADEQILTAFNGIKIEGLGTEKIKIINIPVALNGWKVQAEFIGEANRVLSDKAAVLINNFEGIYQDEPQTGTEEQSAEHNEEKAPDDVQSAYISPITTEIIDKPGNTAAETNVTQTDSSGTEQRTINVVSLWNDNSNAAGKRPAMTIVELYRDDALYFTAVLNDTNGWMYSFNNLPEGNYKIKENEIPDYTVSYSVSGETVTAMHTLSDVSGQQMPGSTNIPSQASASYPREEDSSPGTALQEPEMQPTETVEPTAVLTPVTAPEQAVHQQNTETDKTKLSEVPGSDRQSSRLMLLVGILGGAGILCIAVAVFLIRKKR